MIDCARVTPQVTWGTSPQDVIAVDGRIPDPAAEADPARRRSIEQALAYMGLPPGAALAGTPIDYAFIGSCTNGRYSDLVAAARVVRGRRVAPGVRALIVPGSDQVKRAAEEAGLDRIFLEAGFEWRTAGCSMCVAGNGDVVPPGKRCISTSNRNFEGRQGPGSRTHLGSPAIVAAAAVSGAIADVRKLVARRLGARTHGEVRAAHWGRGSPAAREHQHRRVIPVPWIVNFGRDLGEGLFGGWRYSCRSRESRLHPQPAALSGRPHPAGRPQFRLWLLPRGGRLGPARLRHPLRDRAELRRHLLRELLQERPPAGRARPSDRSRPLRGVAEAPSPQLTVDLQACTVEAPAGPRFRFTVQESRRQTLLRGLDEVGLTLTHGATSTLSRPPTGPAARGSTPSAPPPGPGARRVKPSLRRLIEQEQPLVTPLAHDALAARMIARAGFRAMAIGGSGLLAARYGLPDVGLAALGEMAAGIQDIVAATDLPAIVDGDDGYGDLRSVVHMVEVYARLGVSGIVLEDQVRMASSSPATPGPWAWSRWRDGPEGPGGRRRQPGDRDPAHRPLRRRPARGAGGGPGRADRYLRAGAHGVFIPGVPTWPASARWAAASEAPTS